MPLEVIAEERGCSQQQCMIFCCVLALEWLEELCYRKFQLMNGFQNQICAPSTISVKIGR